MTEKQAGECKNLWKKNLHKKDYDNASKGVCGDECLVGDYDDICYPCQFKQMENKNE